MKNLEEILESGKKHQLRVEHYVKNEGGMGLLTINGIRSSVVWTFNNGWEHVSVSPLDNRVTPSWDFMCQLKDMFYYDTEAVVQYHPRKEDYINLQKNCLHLWRPTDQELPIPNKLLVL